MERKIIYRNDSIFNSSAKALVNPVDTTGVMGKGLALEFKRRYPEMYKSYKMACANKAFDIGYLHYYPTSVGFIINFPTKRHWRDKSQLSYIEDGLKQFNSVYEKLYLSSVSFPKLGCGLGGLNWEDEVKPLMERYLNDIYLVVYIHV